MTRALVGLPAFRVSHPSAPAFSAEVHDLLHPAFDWLRDCGALGPSDAGLYVFFWHGARTVRAAWCPRLGWGVCGAEALVPLPEGPAGPALAALALGGRAPVWEGFAGWLGEALSDPASIHLALSVMSS